MKRSGSRRLAAVVALLPATALAAPESSGLTGLVQVISGLAIVLAAIAAVAWLLRRIGPLGQSAGHLIKVVATLPVSTKERLVLIEIQGEWLLLGVAPGRVSMLHRLDKPEQAPGSALPEANQTFIQTLIQHVKQSPPRV
jgi:flagellar protein FliO/FliZ